MIHVTFVEPNFRVRVRDPGGKEQTWILHAPDELALRTSFAQNYGWQLTHLEPYEFNEWRQRAAAAKQKLLAARARNEEPKYNSALWGELKPFLFHLFHNKCAYCDATVLPTAWGDVEHYRPKGRVQEDAQHPGYYWLAYEATNYLPACQPCNQGGKRDHFPIDGTRATREGDPLDAEQPQLVTPYEPPTQNWFVFIGETGQVVGRNPRGSASVEIYTLNRGDLVNERRAAFEHAQQEIGLAIAGGVVSLRAKLAQMRSGSRPFTAVWHAALEQLRSVLEG